MKELISQGLLLLAEIGVVVVMLIIIVRERQKLKENEKEKEKQNRRPYTNSAAPQSQTLYLD